MSEDYRDPNVILDTQGEGGNKPQWGVVVNAVANANVYTNANAVQNANYLANANAQTNFNFNSNANRNVNAK